MDVTQAQFRFTEELALKYSLRDLGETVLKHAVLATGADEAVFLYSPPGAKYYERVATHGISDQEKSNWERCELSSSDPLAKAIQTGAKATVESNGGVSYLAFPLRDDAFTIAGFSLKFAPGTQLSNDQRELLKTIVERTELALSGSTAEGV